MESIYGESTVMIADGVGGDGGGSIRHHRCRNSGAQGVGLWIFYCLYLLAEWCSLI